MADNKARIDDLVSPAAAQGAQRIIELAMGAGIIQQDPEIVALLVAWRMLKPEQKVDQYAHLFKVALDNRDEEIKQIKEAERGKRIQPNG